MLPALRGEGQYQRRVKNCPVWYWLQRLHSYWEKEATHSLFREMFPNERRIPRMPDDGWLTIRVLRRVLQRVSGQIARARAAEGVDVAGAGSTCASF